MDCATHIRRLNTRLSGVMADSKDWDCYGIALCEAANELGVAFLTEDENALASAYQLDTCIQSSGLFAYFELQTHWAQFGVKAMQRLEVPQLAEMLSVALSNLGLPTDADEHAIETAMNNLIGDEPFIKLLDAFRPLEEIYYSNHDALVAAFVAFAANNSGSLLRKSSQGNRISPASPHSPASRRLCRWSTSKPT